MPPARSEATPPFKIGNEPGGTQEHGHLGSRVLMFQQERVHDDFTEIGICKNQTHNNVVVSHERSNCRLFVFRKAAYVAQHAFAVRAISGPAATSFVNVSSSSLVSR
jgi:hypothetical protein